MEKLLWISVFFTPLAINFSDIGGFGISLPTEPIMIGLMGLFIIKTFYAGFDAKILKHPVTIAILINLIWIFVTCFTSAVPFVSFKFLLARLWFIVSFYFLATQLFKTSSNLNKFHWLFAGGLSITIIYTLYNHALHNFEEEPAHWVMWPFFNDHTIYGALLAMFLPVFFYYGFNKNQIYSVKVISVLLIILLFIALFFSYTRAAWLSLAGALGVYFIFLLRIKFTTILLVSAVMMSLFFIFKTEILMSLEKNEQDSSTNIAEHFQSMTNISTDVSNLERINRWNSALRMFKERPLFGFGPGTYAFQYAPYQVSTEKTIISTNFGEGGNAHSEYLGPLAESGILGMLSFIAIAVCSIYTAAKIYYNKKTNRYKYFALALLLGLTTYLVHGVLNSFLDTDKGSVPFWAFIAMLVAIDVYHQKNEGDD